MSVTSNGTPTLTAMATPALALTVAATWGTGQTRTAGHLLIAAVTAYGNTTITVGAPPVGWEQIQSEVAGGTTGAWTYMRVATGADAAPTVTATATGTAADCSIEVVLYDFSDSSGLTPVWAQIDGIAVGTSGTITATTSGNVPVSGCEAIGFTKCSQGTTNTTTTWTTPSGWGQAATSPTGTSFRSQMAAYTIAPSSGSTLSALFTHSRTSTEQTAIVTVIMPPVPLHPAIRSATPWDSGASIATTQNILVPTLNIGDLILIWATSISGTNTFTAPTGGSTFTSVTLASGSNVVAQLFWTIATAADVALIGSNYVLTQSAAHALAGSIIILKGPAVLGFDQAPTSGQMSVGAASTFSVTGITTANSGDLLMLFGVSRIGAGGPEGLGWPTNYNLAISQDNSTEASTGNVGTMMAWTTQAVAGATGSQTLTVAASNNGGGMLLAIILASQPPVVVPQAIATASQW